MYPDIFKENKTFRRFIELTKWPLWFLVGIGLLTILAPLLANEQPLVVKYKGHLLFPAFGFQNAVFIKNTATGVEEKLQYDITEWKKIKTDWILFPPIPYSPGKSDFINGDYISPAGKQMFETSDGRTIEIPLRYRHLLGTGKRGDDVLAGLIHGTRISFSVGLLAMMIASVIGVTLGSIAGYFGDQTIKISRGALTGMITGFIPAFFYAFRTRHYILVDAFESSSMAGFFQLFISLLIFFILLYLFFRIGKMLQRIKCFDKKISLPVDSIISRIIEIFISLPRLLLIITLAAITKPSFLNLVLIIGFTAWTEIARLMRAEFLRLRELDYITAARALGYSNTRIILLHALPNGIGPVLVSIAFGAAAAILAESSLSFLGIGVPQDVVTWGSLLANGKENVQAWWLVVFPGVAVFITVIIYNMLGEGIRKALLPDERIGK